jgi:hypothetical protein
VTLQWLRELIGAPLRASAIWEDEKLTPADLTTWAGVAAAAAASSNIHYQWQYFLKRWACNRLVVEDSEGPYDLVVTMRPDVWLFQPWKLTMHDHHTHEPHAKRRVFSLRVGADSPLAFGEQEIVMNAFTIGCASDWLAIASLNASTSLAQLVHHMVSANAFMPCVGLRNHLLRLGAELMLGSYLWRVGLPRRLHPLHVELARRLGKEYRTSAVAKLLGTAPNSTSLSDALLASYASAYGRRQNGVFDNGFWQKYCSTSGGGEAYLEYSDSFVLEDDGSRPAHPTGWHAQRLYNKTGKMGVESPFCTVRAMEASNLTSDSIRCAIRGNYFEACADAVDLMKPLVSCSRATLSARVRTVEGRGQLFPLDCRPKPCAPLPNVSWFE